MRANVIKLSLLLLVVTALLLGRFLLLEHYLTLEGVKEHREQLLAFVRSHYFQAVFTLLALYVASALFLPGALVLTLGAGMLFGVVQAALYANLGASAGAVLAFLASRFVMGEWIQRRFEGQLRRLNRELAAHGGSYLLTLRILPVAPFFVINYCAGLTRIPLWTFVWTTSLGMIPGSLIYGFIGQELGRAKEPTDLFSARIIVPLLLLALLSLSPVIRHHLLGDKKEGRGDPR